MGLWHLYVTTLQPLTSRQSKIHRTKPCRHALFTQLATTEAVLIMLKAFFKISDDKLTLQNAVEVMETEGTTKVGKETVYGSTASATTAGALKMGQETKA